MTLKLVTAPSNIPIELDVLKTHIKVDGDDEDTLLTGYVKAVAGHFVSVMCRGIITQSWAKTFNGFARVLILPLGEFQAVEEIKYYDQDNEEQTLNSSEYEYYPTSKGACVEIKNAPSTYKRDGAVTVKYTIGFGTSHENVPEEIKQAIMMTVADWYENRGETTHSGAQTIHVSVGAMNLLEPYKLNWIV